MYRSVWSFKDGDGGVREFGRSRIKKYLGTDAFSCCLVGTEKHGNGKITVEEIMLNNEEFFVNF